MHTVDYFIVHVIAQFNLISIFNWKMTVFCSLHLVFAFYAVIVNLGPEDG